jgi:hypothetical protein
MEKRGIQELEHKIKELEKESEKKENYMKELEHKDNYIKELEDKIKELETSHTDTAIMPTDLGTGLCSLMAAYISEPNSPEPERIDITEPENLWESMTDIWEPERVEESFTPLTTFATTTEVRGLSTPTFSPVKMFTLTEDAGETSSPIEESVSHEEELPEE